MERKKRSVSCWMRILHRDLGFLIMGVMLIYALSGIVMIYRDTDFLKVENQYQKKVAQGLGEAELPKALGLRSVKVLSIKGDTLVLENGIYNRATGEAQYQLKELVAPFNKMSSLHKTISSKMSHYWGLLFGFSLAFMAISSLFMIPKGKNRTRAITLLAGGFIGALIILFVL